MVFLKKRADDHVFFKCNYCGKIDEVAIIEGPDGKLAMTLIVKEWEEVLDESIEDLIAQLQHAVKKLGAWRDGNKKLLNYFQQAIAGWKEFQHVLYFFPADKPADHSIKSPWQFTVIEADRELSAARALAALGYYKDAFKSLRSYMELVLLGLSFSGKNEEVAFRRWFLGGEKSRPVTGNTGLVKYLLKNSILNDTDKSSSWAEDIKEQYKLLSKFVHGQGKQFSNLWLWQKANPQFNEDAWCEWIEQAVKTIRLVSVAVIGYFPRSWLPVSFFEKFGFDGPASIYLDYEQVEVIKGIFRNSKYIEEIGKSIGNDVELLKEISGIERMQDLNETEILESLQRFLKSIKDAPVFKEVEAVMNDERFKNNRSVQWTILLNQQRKFVRDASLMIIARELELLKSEA